MDTWLFMGILPVVLVRAEDVPYDAALVLVARTATAERVTSSSRTACLAKGGYVWR